MQTPQPHPGSEARDVHPQSHSVGLQAKAATHHLSSISTPILKLKVIGMNSDTGTHAFGMNYQHIYPCILLHPLVRERLKAATCIQKINCQISLLLQPAATVTQKITKASAYIVIFTLTEKSQLFLYLLSNSKPFILNQVTSRCVPLYPSCMAAVKKSAAPDNVFHILCNLQIPGDSNEQEYSTTFPVTVGNVAITLHEKCVFFIYSVFKGKFPFKWH